MSNPSRRDLLTVSALVVTAAQNAPAQVGRSSATANEPPKRPALNPHELATLRTLCDLILPADEHGPAASTAKVAEWIELMSSQREELRILHTGGIGWIDQTMLKRCGKRFRDASPGQQSELLNLIAYRKNDDEENLMGPGVQYFSFLRMMAVDGYYTSAEGISAIGFLGNRVVDEFTVPKECSEYALRHSPFANEQG
jgi:hypothetical protein